MLSRRNLLLAGSAALVVGVPGARGEDLKPKAACPNELRSPVVCMALSPDSQTLVSGHYGRKDHIYVWDATNLKLIGSWHSDRRRVLSVAFHPSGEFFASGGDHGILYFWDPKTGKRLAELPTDHREIRRVAFSPDGKFVAVAALDRLVRIWNVSTKQVAYEFEGPRQLTFLVAFSATNLLLAAGGLGPVRIWDLATKEIIHECHQHKYDLHAAWFTDDGKTVVTACTKEIRRAKIGSPNDVTVDTFDKYAIGIAWTPDRKLQASYHEMGLVEFRGEGKEPKRASVVDGRGCTSLCLSNDGKLLYTGVGDEPVPGRELDPRTRNPLICVWDVNALLRP